MKQIISPNNNNRMRNLPATILLTTAFLIGGCKKDGGNGGGSPIGTSTDAKSVFIAINNLWEDHLKTALTKSAQTYNNYQLTDSSGNHAIVGGSYTTSNYSGSSGSVNSGFVNVKITFSNFTFDGLTLNGTMNFVDQHETRTDCGSAGCATASSKSIAYRTADTTAASAVSVKLATSTKQINDQINLSSEKEYSTFSVSLITADRTTFRFSY